MRQSRQIPGSTVKIGALPGVHYRNTSLVKQLLHSWELYLFLLPAVAHIFIFKYIPMYGLRIAFTDGFSLRAGRSAPEWNHFAHFIRFFQSPYFFIVIKNTAIISLYSLLAWPLPLVLAILLNEIRNKFFKRTIQLVTYAPYFISTVVIVGMLYVFLSPGNGVINSIIKTFGGDPVFFMGEPKWGPSLFVLSELWQQAGYQAIIYFAALSTVDTSVREAAFCDGASKLQIIWRIELPWIAPTIVILFIMRLGRLLTIGFEKVLLMQNDLNIDTLEVISTYVYRAGILEGQYDYATAVGLLETILNFSLLIFANRISKKATGTSLW